MGIHKDVAHADKWRERRRGVRLNSRVAVALDWTPEGGDKQHVEVHTRMVNPYGCLVVLTHDLAFEQKVQLTNLATHKANDAVVVWKGSMLHDGREFGIELIGPEMDFWGLEL
jgi:hypothetical protein